MKKSVAMKWVNALRSGKYKQGFGKCFDHRTGEYCVLGVFNKIQKYKTNVTVEPILMSAMSEAEATMWYELNDGLHTFSEFRYDHLSFDEIADVIQIYYVEGM
jgi:hypothetical protein